MDIGIITGRVIKTNRDGDKQRVMLQVELIADEDIRTVELFTQAGEDTNPANGCRVIILNVSDSNQVAVGVSDGITPTVSEGEKEFYSTDSPVTTKKARLKLTTDSKIIMNAGTDNAVKHAALVSALNTFLTALNGQLTGLGAPGGLTIDLTNAKSGSVYIP